MAKLLTEEGRFKARPKSWAVEENKNTGTLQFACVFGIIAAFNGSEWEDWSQYDLEKTGYVYLAKKDGTPNELCIRSLRESLGWDGVNLEALQNTDWSQTVVQITTAIEEYNGEKRLKIRFINPENWEGAQVKPLDPVALKSLNAKWGAKLRASAPKAAAKPATNTASPKPVPAKAPPPPPAPAQSLAARESAWARVLAVFGNEPQGAAEGWTALLAKVFPGKPESSFTATDWSAIEARAGEALPF